MPNPNDTITKLIQASRDEAMSLAPGQAMEKLLGMINKRPIGTSPGSVEGVGELPPVPRAPAFRPYPNILGGRGLARAVDKALKVAPEMQGSFSKVSYAPTDGVVGEMSRSGIPPIDFPNTNLLGLHDRKDRSIYINPNLKSSLGELDSTLIHEMSHAQGNNETGARLVQELLKRATDPTYGEDPAELLMKALQKAGIKSKMSIER